VLLYRRPSDRRGAHLSVPGRSLGLSVYSLRHYAITFWLRRGIPVHVVQKMAGHTNLSTTQRYVHFLKDDLEDAARRLSGVGNMLETPSGEAKGQDERAA
jgi:integrase